MATTTSYAPGTFCWFELATKDTPAAKTFYSSLFGWQADDNEYAPGMIYTTLRNNGKSVGALYSLDASQLDQGVRPHWNLYIAVASADESTAKAKSLGGAIIKEPFDAAEHGRMSVVQDPTGAMVCLWQAKNNPGAQLVDQVNSFCWPELYTRDPEEAKVFYMGLLGWDLGGDANYTEWKSGGRPIGGMMEIKPEWGPVPPHWNLYVMVENCDESTTKAKELGAQVIMAPDTIPGVGRYSMLLDPQGAKISLFQPSSQGREAKEK